MRDETGPDRVRPYRVPPTSPQHPAGDDASHQESLVALLAAEALSLVVRSCSTRIGIRALRDLAEGDAGLLLRASRRCRGVESVDGAVREHAARLLRRAAEERSPGRLRTPRH